MKLIIDFDGEGNDWFADTPKRDLEAWVLTVVAAKAEEKRFIPGEVERVRDGNGNTVATVTRVE